MKKELEPQGNDDVAIIVTQVDNSETEANTDVVRDIPAVATARVQQVTDESSTVERVVDNSDTQANTDVVSDIPAINSTESVFSQGTVVNSGSDDDETAVVTTENNIFIRGALSIANSAFTTLLILFNGASLVFLTIMYNLFPASIPTIQELDSDTEEGSPTTSNEESDMDDSTIREVSTSQEPHDNGVIAAAKHLEETPADQHENRPGYLRLYGLSPEDADARPLVFEEDESDTIEGEGESEQLDVAKAQPQPLTATAPPSSEDVSLQVEDTTAEEMPKNDQAATTAEPVTAENSETALAYQATLVVAELVPAEGDAGTVDEPVTAEGSEAALEYQDTLIVAELVTAEGDEPAINDQAALPAAAKLIIEEIFADIAHWFMVGVPEVPISNIPNENETDHNEFLLGAARPMLSYDS